MTAQPDPGNGGGDVHGQDPSTGNNSGNDALTAPVNIAAPTISGEARQGKPLTATPGEWSGFGARLTVRWLRCDVHGDLCTPIAGATELVYTPVGEDRGAALRVEVTATTAGGSASSRSAASGEVRAPAPVNLTAPAITGAAAQGKTLTASAGTWADASSFGFQWLLCDASGGSCEPILGATAQSLTLTGAHVGHTLRVTVRGDGPGGTAPVTSAPTAPVAPPPPTNLTTPSIISETASSLTASAGSWANQPIRYTYRWEMCLSTDLRDCAPAYGSGQTTTTFTPKPSTGRGHVYRFRLRVTAINAGGESVPVFTGYSLMSRVYEALPS